MRTFSKYEQMAIDTGMIKKAEAESGSLVFDMLLKACAKQLEAREKFCDKVAALATGEILFEAARTAFVKREDGRLWVTGDNAACDEVIPDVTSYIVALRGIINAAAEWDADGEDEDLARDVQRVRDEIADY